MSIEAQFEALIPVLAAALCAAVIGLDREWRHRPAGLRTHMLVGMGAALVMSMASLKYGEASAARLAANVITGIGFIGAGVIFQRKNEVHDLTTAASIWFVAMIGLTAGSKLYVLAAGATVLGWFVLYVMRRWTKHPQPPV
jgi:putative Mg2+ transporter-C (MgtC) family protein